MATCDEDFIGGLFLEGTTSLVLIILLQISWLTYTLHIEYTRRNTQSFRKINKTLRILYLLFQICGLFWTVMDLLRLVIDPHTHAIRDSIGCALPTYTPKILPAPYYGLYLWQILLRLIKAFNNSSLAISKRTIRILKTLLVLVLTGPIWFVIIIQGESSCLSGWKPLDFPSWYQRSDRFAYCHLPMRLGAAVVVIIEVLLVVSLNIAFGIIFAKKLYIMMSRFQGDLEIGFQFKSLIVKQSILAITGSVSTVSSSMIWLAFSIASPLYIDLMLNVFVMGLMFEYNAKFYKRFCRCCILMCFMKCDSSEYKVEEKVVMQYLSHSGNVNSETVSNTSIDSKFGTNATL